MNWFRQYRLDWIDEMLSVYRFINREHLMRKFDISMPQASADLNAFDKAQPGRMVYSMAAKRYEVATIRPSARRAGTKRVGSGSGLG